MQYENLQVSILTYILLLSFSRGFGKFLNSWIYCKLQAKSGEDKA